MRKMNRDRRGRLINSVPKSEVRRMFADYKRTKTLRAAAQLHGISGASMHRLLVSRGFIKSKPRKVPRETLAKMYWNYIAGLSLAKVAGKFGRTRQCVFDLFKSRGLRLRKREFLPAIEYKGRKYTCQKTSGRHRYLRDTIRYSDRGGCEIYLHHVIWIENNGPIPPGHKVCFKDGNHLNCAIDNLELLTNSEQVRKHATGANQFTVTAKSRLNILLGNFEEGGGLASELKARAA